MAKHSKKQKTTETPKVTVQPTPEQPKVEAKAETTATPEAPQAEATPVTEPAKAEPAKAKRSNEWRKQPRLQDDDVVLFQEAAYNAKPKRGRSEVRIKEAYNRGPEGRTVLEIRNYYEEQRKAGRVEFKGGKAFANADLAWDREHGFITVKPRPAAEPAKEEAKAS